MKNPEEVSAVETIIEKIEQESLKLLGVQYEPEKLGKQLGLSFALKVAIEAKELEHNLLSHAQSKSFQKGFLSAKKKAEPSKNENQFVLNMPFKIIPLFSEVVKKVSKSKWEETTIKGYIITDAKGVEYFFYEDGEGVLKYDGWSADLKTTKED
jgi:hypothetical protein